MEFDDIEGTLIFYIYKFEGILTFSRELSVYAKYCS